MPNVSVATVKLPDDAMNLYRLLNEVDEITPFMSVAKTALPALNVRLFKLIKLVVETSPLTIDVKVFTTEFNDF